MSKSRLFIKHNSYGQYIALLLMSIVAWYNIVVMDIINKWPVGCSSNNYTTIIWYHICAVCIICGLRSSSFESTAACILQLLLVPPCRNLWYNNSNSFKSFVPVCNKSAKGASKWSSPGCQSICTSMVVRYEFVHCIRTLTWLWYLQSSW